MNRIQDFETAMRIREKGVHVCKNVNLGMTLRMMRYDVLECISDKRNDRIHLFMKQMGKDIFVVILYAYTGIKAYACHNNSMSKSEIFNTICRYIEQKGIPIKINEEKTIISVML